MDDMPRIDTVAVDGSTVLDIGWRSGARSRIDLADWLGWPNAALGALSDPAVFARAAVGATAAS